MPVKTVSDTKLEAHDAGTSVPSTSSLMEPKEGRRLLDLERSGEEQEEAEELRE